MIAAVVGDDLKRTPGIAVVKTAAADAVQRVGNITVALPAVGDGDDRTVGGSNQRRNPVFGIAGTADKDRSINIRGGRGRRIRIGHHAGPFIGKVHFHVRARGIVEGGIEDEKFRDGGLDATRLGTVRADHQAA